MNIALVTAAGIGSRMQQEIPKQFINVLDKPLIIFTLEAFEKHPDIDAILVVCLDGWHEILRAYAKQFNIAKLKWIVSGGATGQESIYNGLKVLQEQCDKTDMVVIHDGNRCLVSADIISDSLAKCRVYGSGVAAIPCVEAVFKSGDKVSSNILYNRDEIVRTQTPHTYKLEKLLWAHSEAQKKEIVNTVATCTLMVELGEKVFFSVGSEKNMKITTMEDLEIFKALLMAQKGCEQ